MSGKKFTLEGVATTKIKFLTTHSYFLEFAKKTSFVISIMNVLNTTCKMNSFLNPVIIFRDAHVKLKDALSESGACHPKKISNMFVDHFTMICKSDALKIRLLVFVWEKQLNLVNYVM